MSETKIPPIPQGIDPELAEKIAGGALDVCDAGQLTALVDSMKQNYDTLVDFTSYVIERVAGNP